MQPLEQSQRMKEKENWIIHQFIDTKLWNKIVFDPNWKCDKNNIPFQEKISTGKKMIIEPDKNCQYNQTH